jgi:predicted heme/steroid binding protein/uncharacterized membrane protein
MKKVTGEELARGTGEDGGPALVAVDGKVYDVAASGLWKGGRHMGIHRAGRDLSAEIKAAPHGAEVLGRADEVGEVAEPAPASGPGAHVEPPALVSMILSRHPHPVSVHFPIALSVAGALFEILGLALGCEDLERGGFYNIVFAAVAAPGAIGAGLLSWRYNYAATMTAIFRGKILLSVLYMVLVVAAVAARLVFPDDATWRWIHLALVVALPPVALGLGYLGGRITFPS